MTDNDPREGLWDPDRKKKKRRRSLPKSQVSTALKVLIAFVLLAAIIGTLH